MTFKDKYDIAGPSVQFHWPLFLGTQRSRSKMGSNGSEDLQNRMTSLVESYSCRCSTTLIGGQKTMSKAVLECNISFPTRETCQVRSLVWTKQRKSVVSLVVGQSERSMQITIELTHLHMECIIALNLSRQEI